MTRSRILVACVTAALVSLGSAAPGSARAAPAARKSGQVKITLTGAKQASGTFPAMCGPYFMQDVRGVAKAGDGLVFETDVTGVGHLQLNSAKRVPGRSSNAGLILNTSDASYTGDARAPSKIVFGPKLDTASVRATLRNVRIRRGTAPEVVTVQADFDCSK